MPSPSSHQGMCAISVDGSTRSAAGRKVRELHASPDSPIPTQGARAVLGERFAQVATLHEFQNQHRMRGCQAGAVKLQASRQSWGDSGVSGVRQYPGIAAGSGQQEAVPVSENMQSPDGYQVANPRKPKQAASVMPAGMAATARGHGCAVMASKCLNMRDWLAPLKGMLRACSALTLAQIGLQRTHHCAWTVQGCCSIVTWTMLRSKLSFSMRAISCTMQGRNVAARAGQAKGQADMQAQPALA